MGTEAAKSVDSVVFAVSKKVRVAGLAFGLVATAITWAWWGVYFAAGTAFGFSLGAVNTFWLLKIAGRVVLMAPEKAGKYAAQRYYLRFFVTALALVIVISQKVLHPWPVLAGLILSIFLAIAVTVSAARQEAKDA